MLSPRAIAVQGLGYGPLLTAVQGLLGVAVPINRRVGPGSTPERRFTVRSPQADDEELLLILLAWLQVNGSV